MASSASIVGMDRDDLAQELRLVIFKAAKKFDPDKNVSFHTYLHTSMVNTIRTLITKAQSRLRSQPQIIAFSNSGENYRYSAENFADPSPTMDNILFTQEVTNINFTDLERQYIQNKLSGYNNKEIYVRLGETSPHQLRIQVKEKLRRYYAEEIQENTDI
jgi:RNA polymerase sigma factor (sigma-70 family)